MSGWHDFVESTLAPIGRFGDDAKREIIDDVVGVAKWGKDTISAIGNTARNSAQGAEKISEALPKAIEALIKAAAEAAETPYFTYLAIGVGGVAAIMLLKK